MHFSSSFSSLLALFALAGSVSAHGVLTAVTGANGVTAQGFGVVSTTPRDGTTRNPFQQDTSIIRDREIRTNRAGVCGRTLAGGNNVVATQLAAAASAGLPSANADGTVTMTLHQVNGDGAGPYTCAVSADATGANFVAMTVTTNVPGRNSRSNARATDFPLVAQMPAGVTCTGGPNGDACLVRCRNAAAAGPFGGCAAVTNAASNTTTSSAVDTSSTVVATDSAATSTAVATDSAATSTATDTTATDTTVADTTATDTTATDTTAASTTAATDSAAVTSTATSTDATASSTALVQKASKAEATCNNRLVRRASRRSTVTEDDSDVEYEIPEEEKDEEIPLEEADRLLAADIEKFRFRAKRLAARLERVKRMRIAARENFD